MFHTNVLYEMLKKIWWLLKRVCELNVIFLLSRATLQEWNGEIAILVGDNKIDLA